MTANCDCLELAQHVLYEEGCFEELLPQSTCSWCNEKQAAQEHDAYELDALKEWAFKAIKNTYDSVIISLRDTLTKEQIEDVKKYTQSYEDIYMQYRPVAGDANPFAPLLLRSRLIGNTQVKEGVQEVITALSNSVSTT